MIQIKHGVIDRWGSKVSFLNFESMIKYFLKPEILFSEYNSILFGKSIIK